MMKISAALFFLGASLLYGQQGSETVMGMRIKSTAEKGGVITVLTTGAKFQIDGQRTVQCWQRIPRERHALAISFAQAVGPFHIEKKDAFSCTVSCQAGALTFQGDSVVILKLTEHVRTTFKGFFNPAYHFEKDGKWMLMDGDGGFGIYPVATFRLSAPVFAKPPWEIVYDFNWGDEAWVSVFPPRPYNWDRAFAAIDHEGLPEEETATALEGAGAYPSNELIQAAAKHCRVFALHAYFWQDAPEEVKEKTGLYAGHPQPWLAPKHVPFNMQEFIRVRDEVHKDGMKLVVYLSPYYSTAPDIFAEMRRVLDEYQVDGLYFDGAANEFRNCYAIMRRARQILGDNRILYYHCSAEPFWDDRIYCPFIDTYADYILRGEAGVWSLKLNDYLHWVLSGYNISNAVGYWCYYGSNRQQGYDASTPQKWQYVDAVPTTEHIDAALKNKVFIWRQGQDWSQPRLKADLARFDKEYYGKVELLRRAWEEQRRTGSETNQTSRADTTRNSLQPSR